MSGEVVGWAFKQAGLSPTQKLVLVAIADNAQDDGMAFPGKKLIVRKTGLGQSTVYRTLDELEEKKCLSKGKDDRGVECYWLFPEREDFSQSGKANSQSGNPLIEEPSVEPSKKQSSPSSPKSSKDRETVWACFVEQMKPRRVEPDDGQRRVIQAALKVASVEECCEAIRKCAASDFHMKRGAYAKRKGGRYNQLSQILKGRRGKESTRERIEWWLDLEVDSHDVLDLNAEAEEMRRLQEDGS